MVAETKVNEFHHLLILSASFTAIFTAYLAIQNLQSSLNQEDGLGIISLSCMYACIIVSGILAPAVINFLGEKRVLVVSFVCHVVYTATNFYPTFATLVPSSVLLGITAGPMWTSQSVYLSEKAVAYAERKNVAPEAILSKYNGVFFAMYETTQITGNLISSLVLQQDTFNGTNANTTLYCGSQDCPSEVNPNSTKIEEPDRHVVYTLLGVFLAIDVIGVLLTTCFLPPLRRSVDQKKGQIIKSVQACGRGLADPNLLMLVPMFMFMAMEQAILWTDYTKAYISCPLGIQKIGFVMATYGGATTVFALTMSLAAKYIGRRVMFGIAGVVNLATFVILYMWTPSPDNSVIIFLVPVAWGLSEGIWQTQSNALVAHLFPDKKEAAFANYHTWKAAGFTVTFVYSNFLCVSTKLIIGIALLVAAMFLYMIVEVRVYRRNKDEYSLPSEKGTEIHNS